MSAEVHLNPEEIADITAIFDIYARRASEHTLLPELQDPATVAAICAAKIEAADEHSWPRILDERMAERGLAISASSIQTRRLRRATRYAIWGAQEATTKPKTTTEIIHALRLFAETSDES
jgi:hypothetical protein